MPRLGVVMCGILCSSVCFPNFAGVSPTSAEASNTLAEFITRNWQREDGLPDNSIKAIIQTRDGYLWIGTGRGLARYDGRKFTVFDRANTPDFKSEDINCLVEDEEGSLWIGTTAGLFRKTGPRFARQDEISNTKIFALCTRKQGGIWVGAWGGLFQIANGQLTRFENSADGKVGGVGGLHEDGVGVLWFGTSDSLRRLDPARAQFHCTDFPPPAPVHATQPVGDGGLWVLCFNASESTGWVYRFQDEQWTKLSDALPLDLRSLFLCPSRAGDLWLSSKLGRMDRFRDGRLTGFPIAQSGPTPYPQCAYEDREGNLWLGTENVGLYRWQPRRIPAFSAQNGLPHDNAWTILETRDGSTWIGTDGGLSRLFHGSFTNFTEREGLPKNTIRALAEDHSERLWVGTSKGLVCIKDGLLFGHQFQGEWFSSKVRALLIDRQDHIWVGSANGLHRMPLPEARTAAPPASHEQVVDPNRAVTYQTKDGLPHNDVSALLEDRSGAIWIGTSGGLCRMQEGRITRVAPASGLANGNVGVLYEDGDGILWIGAERVLHRHQDGRFTAYTTREGLFDDVINSILEDDRGQLWFGGDRGIYRIAKADLNDIAIGYAKRVAPVVYTEADGLPSNETNGQKCQPAGWKSRDGRLWFPTTKGVVTLDPQHLPDNTNPPPVVIEQVRANGQIVFDDGDTFEFRVSGSELERSRTRANSRPEVRNPELRLPPGAANVLEFQYTANSFTAPERIRFKYKLQGQDKDWVDAGLRRTAYYTNLRPGDYHFCVAAANSHGVWNDTGATLALHVAPHYYQTLTFKLACVLAAGLSALGAYRWRVTGLRKLQRLEQQAALTAERARIAKDLHDGLGANLTHLTLLAEMAEQEISEALPQRIRTLSASSREAVRSLKDFLWTTHPADETIDGLVARICQHAEEFLGAPGIRCRFELPEEWPAHALPSAARQNLFLVAKEALNNIAKHSAASEVRIRAAADNEAFTLEIEDNGRGFDPDNSNLESPNSIRARTGHGLGNMRSRIEEAGGQFALETRPGSGTRIHIQLPIHSLKDEGTGH